MQVSIDDKELRAFLKKFPSASAKEVGKALDAIGDAIRKTAIERISDTRNRSGKEYKIKKQGGKNFFLHTASAEGEYPAAITGNLANTINKNIINDSLVEVTANAVYAARLEYDLNRPFMAMSIEENDKKIAMEIEKAADRIVNL